MGALKAIKINQNDGRAVFLCLPKTKYRVTKGFKFHARSQTGAYSCLVLLLVSKISRDYNLTLKQANRSTF